MNSSLPHNTPIALWSTGGTFEKVYRENTGSLGFNSSRLNEFKQICRLPENTVTYAPFQLDSLDLTEMQRETLCKQIAQAAQARLVVIHGTDTLVQTALLCEKTRRPEQTIVFTGAMIPASVEHSDALFNLGMAFAAAQLAAPGVWVACSGQILQAQWAQKDKTLGRFVSTQPVGLFSNTELTKDTTQ